MIIKISPQNFGEVIKKATKFIQEGKVLICPTDTVYGLICAADNKKAVEKLFRIKKRKLNKPVPIFIKDIKMAKKLAYINKNQEKILKKCWPSLVDFKKNSRNEMVEIAPKIWINKGKVTVILKRKKRYQLYGVDQKTIGLRIPKYKFILELLKRTKRPLTGTSANISGQNASTKIKEVIKQFENQKDQPDLIIWAGNLPESRPSKVIDLTKKKIKILRE